MNHLWFWRHALLEILYEVLKTNKDHLKVYFWNTKKPKSLKEENSSKFNQKVWDFVKDLSIFRIYWLKVHCALFDTKTEFLIFALKNDFQRLATPLFNCIIVVSNYILKMIFQVQSHKNEGRWWLDEAPSFVGTLFLASAM